MQCMTFMDYYSEIRLALFLSGITVGSFLFSMKSMIINAMKVNCYDRPEYKRRIRERRRHGQDIGYYSSLKNFSLLFAAAIAVSVVSAVMQLTLGFLGILWVAIFCISFALFSWVLLGVVLYLVSSNWLLVLKYEEAAALEDEQKAIGGKE